MTRRFAPRSDWADQNVREALIRVMRDLPEVGKDSRNIESPDQFLYRGIDAIVNAVGPLFRKHGVLCLPKVLKASIRGANTDRGAAVVAVVRVRYTFHGPDGSKLKLVVPGEAMDVGDKALNKAMSVAWRTALIQALAIPTGEPDPDANSFRRRADQDRAAEGSQQQQQRPQGDPRGPVWDQIIKATTTAGLSREWSIADFRTWSGGHEINAPIATTTLEMVSRYLEELPGRIAAMREQASGKGEGVQS